MKRIRLGLWVVGAAIGVGWAGSAAAADPPAATAPRAPAAAAKPAQVKSQAQVDLGAGAAADRPWAKAVSPADQRLAGELFREGNALLKESLFVQAAEKYREALARWNHPGIHYNLALALLNLDQPVEVFTQLEEAMKYGAAPLDADKFEHAGRYKALIEKQLSRLEITCGHPGAQVSLDGRPLFVAPGRFESLVRVGQHTVVATKTGFITTQKTPNLPAGQKSSIALSLYTADDLTQYRRHFANAIPWSVLAAGIVVAGVGGILHWQASESFKKYDAGVTSCGATSPSGGCRPDAALQDKKNAGESLQAAAFATYAIGGAAVVAGAVLLYYNRARPFRINPEKDGKVAIAPLIYGGAGGGGVVATVTF